MLALRTGAALAVGALFQRPGGRYHAVVLDPIDVEAGKTDPDRVRALTEQVVEADGGTDPPGAGPMASVPAELAERPWISA